METQKNSFTKFFSKNFKEKRMVFVLEGGQKAPEAHPVTPKESVDSPENQLNQLKEQIKGQQENFQGSLKMINSPEKGYSDQLKKTAQDFSDEIEKILKSERIQELNDFVEGLESSLTKIIERSDFENQILIGIDLFNRKAPDKGEHTEAAKKIVIEQMKAIQDGLTQEVGAIMLLQDIEEANKEAIALAYTADTIKTVTINVAGEEGQEQQQQTIDITPENIKAAIVAFELGLASIPEETLTEQQKQSIAIITAITGNSETKDLFNIKITGTTDAERWRKQNPESKESQDLYRKMHSSFGEITSLLEVGKIEPAGYLTDAQKELLDQVSKIDLDVEGGIKQMHDLVEANKQEFRIGANSLFNKALALQRAQSIAGVVRVEEPTFNLESREGRGQNDRIAKAELKVAGWPGETPAAEARRQDEADTRAAEEEMRGMAEEEMERIIAEDEEAARKAVELQLELDEELRKADEEQLKAKKAEEERKAKEEADRIQAEEEAARKAEEEEYKSKVEGMIRNSSKWETNEAVKNLRDNVWKETVKKISEALIKAGYLPDLELKVVILRGLNSREFSVAEMNGQTVLMRFPAPPLEQEVRPIVTDPKELVGAINVARRDMGATKIEGIDGRQPPEFSEDGTLKSGLVTYETRNSSPRHHEAGSVIRTERGDFKEGRLHGQGIMEIRIEKGKGGTTSKLEGQWENGKLVDGTITTAKGVRDVIGGRVVSKNGFTNTSGNQEAHRVLQGINSQRQASVAPEAPAPGQAQAPGQAPGQAPAPAGQAPAPTLNPGTSAEVNRPPTLTEITKFSGELNREVVVRQGQVAKFPRGMKIEFNLLDGDQRRFAEQMQALSSGSNKPKQSLEEGAQDAVIAEEKNSTIVPPTFTATATFNTDAYAEIDREMKIPAGIKITGGTAILYNKA